MLKDEEGTGATAVRAARSWLDVHGLPLPSLTVNGLLIDELDLQRIMTFVSQDMRVLQGLVASGHITDSTNVYVRPASCAPPPGLPLPRCLASVASLAPSHRRSPPSPLRRPR